MKKRGGEGGWYHDAACTTVVWVIAKIFGACLKAVKTSVHVRIVQGLSSPGGGAGVKFSYSITVSVGMLTVTVEAVIPAHEQALLYSSAKKHAEAYGGILVGVTCTWRLSSVSSVTNKSSTVTVVV